MRLTELEFDDAKPVEGYGPGFFRIAGEVLAGPLLITAKGARPWGGVNDHDTLLALAGSIDVVFLGTGDDIAHIPADLRQAVEGAGIGIEAMSSPAACRTFNVLVNDGRRIAAALLPITKG
ncbi:MAG: Mth938-like domain-containing protein [Planktotalea sp.]|uniref:Mth938-like domain-containing protein n=1 Tax=Planktotalea sp. TaxID=2029877 RepID=UPI003C71D8CC